MTIAVEPQLITLKALQIFGSAQYNSRDVARYLSFMEANPQLHEGTVQQGAPSVPHRFQVQGRIKTPVRPRRLAALQEIFDAPHHAVVPAIFHPVAMTG